MNEAMNEQPIILAVDDNPLNLQLISSQLKNNGYKVVVANSGDNALKYLDHKHADLILLDIMMPGLSGFDVCKTIKQDERLAPIPIIFLTAKSEVTDITEGFRIGAVDYITKPFQSEEVMVRVGHHLELCRTRKQLEQKNTELKALAAELEKRNKIISDDAQKLSELNAEKDKLFSIISHDLRGPFSGFLAASEMLSDSIDKMSRNEIVEFTKALNGSANQMNNLLENLLRWAQLQMGAVKLVMEEIVLLDLLQEVRDAYQGNIVAKNIQFELNCSDTIRMHADRNMAMSILRNLLSNAIKFTPRKGVVQISVSLASAKDFIQVQVTDSGIGMNKELVNRLFKISEKVSRPGTEGEPSTGLGLSLSADLAQKMGGSIMVESTEGKGSTFKLTLPGSVV